MSMQRITVSLPKYIYEDLGERIPQGKVSSFVAQAVERKLLELKTDPINEFIALRKKLPKKSRAEVLAAIKKGRE